MINQKTVSAKNQDNERSSQASSIDEHILITGYQNSMHVMATDIENISIVDIFGFGHWQAFRSR